MNTKPKIILVDDIASTDKDVKNGLENIGITPEITFINPKDREIPIEEEMPTDDELNVFDLALIDLELYSPDDRKYHLKNLAGGMRVLPYLRKNAPWLPVISVSKLFSDEDPSIHAIAGSFGFDGQIPRVLFPTNKITREIWNTVIEQAIHLRKRAVLTNDYFKATEQTVDYEKVICDPPDLKDELDKNFPPWKNLILNCFYYSEQIVLSTIPGGFSGAITLKAEAVENKVGKSTVGNWLLKISKNPSKLNKEVYAHQKMIRSGQEYARTVPLLWNSVLVEDGIGVIGYQFASNTKTALECLLDKDSNVTTLCNEVEDMFREMYSSEKIEAKLRISFSELINKWFSLQKIKNIAKYFKGHSFGKTLETIAAGNNPDKVPNAIKPTTAWLHGDLHLRNVLIGERNVLIDFARSDFGAVVIDLAKFISDLFLRTKELRSTKHSIFDQTGRYEILPGIASMNNIITLNDDDKALYEILVKLYLAFALDYPDVDEESKVWIMNTISDTV